MLSLLLFLLLSPVNVVDSPLGLPWGETLSDSFRTHKNYKYILGDVTWGAMRFEGYVGEDFKSELLLQFTGRKLNKAYLILGPTGLSEDNCFTQYAIIVSSLNTKYGGYYRRSVIKSSLINELVFVSECYAMKVGVAEVITKWKIKNFEINALLFADKERDLYIEIEYIYLPLSGLGKKELIEHL